LELWTGRAKIIVALTLKWEMLLEIATDRARWRKVVKADGVCKALNQWYIAENTKSNK